MPIPLLSGLLAFGAGSLIGRALRGGGRQAGDIQTISTLTPEQGRIAASLADLIGENLGRPAQGYEGPLVAPLSGLEQQAMGAVSNLLAAGGLTEGLPALPRPVTPEGLPALPQPVALEGLPALPRPVTPDGLPALPQPVTPDGLPALPRPVNPGDLPALPQFASPQAPEALSRILAGQPAFQVTPQETQALFEQAVAAPALRQFQQDILPATREAFVGPGTFWSSMRAQAEARAGQDLATQLAAQRAQLALADVEAQRRAAENAAQRAASVLPAALSFALQSSALPFEQSLQARQQAFREALGGFEQAMQARQQAFQEALGGFEQGLQARQEAFQEALGSFGQALRAREQAFREALGGFEQAMQARQQAFREALGGFEQGMQAREQAFREALGSRGAALEAIQLGALLGQQARGVEQQALQSAYQEFLRTRPEASPWLNAALAFLGEPMMAAFQPPFQPSPFSQLLGLAGQLGSAWLAGGAPGLSRLLAVFR